MTDEQRQRLPTQSTRPWKAVLRTLIVAVLALIPFVQSAAVELGINEIPWIAGTLVFMAALQRVLAVPAVELFLQSYVPWLAAGAYVGKHRGEKNNDYTPTPTVDGGK